MHLFRQARKVDLEKDIFKIILLETGDGRSPPSSPGNSVFPSFLGRILYELCLKKKCGKPKGRADIEGLSTATATSYLRPEHSWILLCPKLTKGSLRSKMCPLT